MTKPVLVNINAAVEAWDGEINDDLAILRDGPMPIKEYAFGVALPAANAYDRCVAFKQLASSGPWYLAYSDGSVWHYLSDEYVPLGDKATVGQVAAKIHANMTPVSNPNSAAEGDLMSFTLPANLFNADLRTIEIDAWGVTANNATAKTLKLYFGGSAIMTVSLTVSQAGVWRLKATISRVSSGNQRFGADVVETGNKTYLAEGTPAVADTGTIVVKLTGQAGATNDLVQKGWVISYKG